MTKDDKLRVSFCRMGDKIIDFSIQLSSKIDGKWKEILRIDTETHGDKNNEGFAHVHHFYAKRSQWYQSLPGAQNKNFNLLYKQWLRDAINRAKYHKRNYLFNK
ncbi:MAG: hypothetical protein Q7K65_05730 [Candidatus Buchananbacteria bacterium]|nr:hypothetical protein [Candidatus Buchananbacteria bacterium]